MDMGFAGVLALSPNRLETASLPEPFFPALHSGDDPIQPPSSGYLGVRLHKLAAQCLVNLDKVEKLQAWLS